MEDVPRKLREIASEILSDHALTLKMLELRVTDGPSARTETMESFLEWGREELERFEAHVRLELPAQGSDDVVRRALDEFAASLQMLNGVVSARPTP